MSFRVTGAEEARRLLSLEDGPEAAPLTCWQRLGKPFVGAMSGAALAASAVAAIVFGEDSGPALRATAYFSLGVGIQTVIDSGLPLKARHIAHKVLSNVATQPTLFALTQAYYDDRVPHIQEAAVNTIIAMGGACVTRMATNILEQGPAVLVESSVGAGTNEPTFQAFWPAKTFQMVEGSMALGCAAVYYSYPDPLARALASFFGPFFALRVAGERISLFIHKKIRDFDFAHQAADGEVEGTNWRIVRLFADTIGAGIPLCLLIPLDGKWLSLVSGGTIGLLDGVTRASQRERFMYVPIAQLTELQPHPDIPIESLAYRAFQVAWPVTAMSGLTIFTIYQERWKLPDEASRTALGLMFGSCLATFGAAQVLDITWDAGRRIQQQTTTVKDRLHDSAICSLMLNPRLPLLLFYAVTNEVNMDSAALASDNRPLYQIAAKSAWIAYGTAMGLEAQSALSNRQGTRFKFPGMFLTNWAQTGLHLMKGEI